MKTFFFSLHIREKVLLTTLLTLIAIVWLGRVARSARVFWVEWRANAAVLAEQQQWIDNRASIEASAAKAIQHLDPARTFSSPRLLGELITIADQVGVRNNTSSEIRETEPTSQFSVNTVQVAVRNTDLPSLLRFYDELDKRSPYIGLEQFSISGNPTNPALLSAVMLVSSVEISR
jgi:DNA integrity scanning protein DisA with diadenylate cyclase activity